MVFLNDLKGKLDVGADFISGTIMVFEQGAYVQGHKGIAELSDVKVVFRIKNKKITITGNKLKLEHISHNSASIKGQVACVNFEEVYKVSP